MMVFGRGFSHADQPFGTDAHNRLNPLEKIDLQAHSEVDMSVVFTSKFF